MRFTVEADERLDQALARSVPGLSRRKARVLIDLGGVFVDKARVKVAGRLVKIGQQIEATLGGALTRALEDTAVELPLPIVYEDDHVVVVDKPAGMVSAPTPESDRGDVLDRLRRRPGAGEVFLVHRIDRPTSGLLIYAKTREANRILGQRFVEHALTRRYVALVVGAPPPELVELDQPIAGQRALTRIVARRALAAGASELTLELETGRTHQIRLHLLGVGCPVLGDRQHGGELARRFRPRAPRLALHAAHLGLRHPITDAPLAWDSPLPPDLAAYRDQLAAAPPEETS